MSHSSLVCREVPPLADLPSQNTDVSLRLHNMGSTTHLSMGTTTCWQLVTITNPQPLKPDCLLPNSTTRTRWSETNQGTSKAVSNEHYKQCIIADYTILPTGQILLSVVSTASHVQELPNSSYVLLLTKPHLHFSDFFNMLHHSRARGPYFGMR